MIKRLVFHECAKHQSTSLMMLSHILPSLDGKVLQVLLMISSRAFLINYVTNIHLTSISIEKWYRRGKCLSVFVWPRRSGSLQFSSLGSMLVARQHRRIFGPILNCRFKVSIFMVLCVFTKEMPIWPDISVQPMRETTSHFDSCWLSCCCGTWVIDASRKYKGSVGHAEGFHGSSKFCFDLQSYVRKRHLSGNCPFLGWGLWCNCSCTVQLCWTLNFNF